MSHAPDRTPLEAALMEMKSLRELSSKATSFAPIDHDYNIAGDRLAELAVETIAKYGLTKAQLSRMLGMTDSALGHFLQRRGVKVPGANDYGPGKRADRCKRGHDLTLPGAKVAPRGCAVCKKIRNAARYTKAPPA